MNKLQNKRHVRISDFKMLKCPGTYLKNTDVGSGIDSVGVLYGGDGMILQHNGVQSSRNLRARKSGLIEELDKYSHRSWPSSHHGCHFSH